MYFHHNLLLLWTKLEVNHIVEDQFQFADEHIALERDFEEKHHVAEVEEEHFVVEVGKVEERFVVAFEEKIEKYFAVVVQ